MSVLETLPAPNYINPEEHFPATSIVNLVLYPLVVIVTLLRIWTRLRISRTFGIDDVLVIIALVCPRPPLTCGVLIYTSFSFPLQLFA